MTVVLGDQCAHYFTTTMQPVCYVGPGFHWHRCCEAVRTFIDDGKCLCEPRVIGDMRGSGRSLAVQITRLCKYDFPLPWNVQKTLELDVCKPYVAASTKGSWNSTFFVRKGSNESDNLLAQQQGIDASKIPSFDDIFEPPPPGPFRTAVAKVVVERDTPSVLKNMKSSATHFGADVYYPVDPLPGGPGSKKVVGRRRVAAGGPFPLVVFSPGYQGVPGHFRRTLDHLASQGVVVISQYSTSHLRVDINRKKMEAWREDMLHMVQFLSRKGGDPESFLSGGVDPSRIGFAGHSFGAGMALSAAALAREERGMNVSAVVPVSAACLIMGNSCEMPSEATPKLHGVKALFIVGSEDRITPPRSTEWFYGLMPEDSEADLMYLEGATHCLFEAEPKNWPNTNSQCGRGSASPQESIRRMAIAMADFFREHFEAAS
ncbi:unnamed protein product [Ostreobium quekettii]|uniref:PET hydrolase/cutinase-like domain-containing protein n=1 Tax=Ostreobium quekettii TaxID=121088 RepID=A0A8S1JGR6_9CHLO|nr:unnamed protein product [Ostreobium quekettii]|eukprot:evm.model.scf_2930.2 EVM.evm.TU.scf_2930.2   scf_2930:15852-18103(-)